MAAGKGGLRLCEVERPAFLEKYALMGGVLRVARPSAVPTLELCHDLHTSRWVFKQGTPEYVYAGSHICPANVMFLIPNSI